MRQGDFSECDPASANYNSVAASNCVVPINPVNNLPFAGDTVPINSNVQAIMDSLVPLPNNGVDGYVKAPSTPTNWRQEQLRVDQNISDKTALFVRYTQDAWVQTLTPALWTGSSYDTIASPFQVPAKNVVVHLTHTFKPDLMNEAILAYGNDLHIIHTVAGPGSPSKSIQKPSTWSVVPIFAANKAETVLPGVCVWVGHRLAFARTPVRTWTITATCRPLPSRTMLSIPRESTP
jgi:hypothetical protein